MNLLEIGVEELTQNDAQEASGGSFGGDVGIAIRFLAIDIWNGGGLAGVAAAAGDYGANKAACSCN